MKITTFSKPIYLVYARYLSFVNNNSFNYNCLDKIAVELNKVRI